MTGSLNSLSGRIYTRQFSTLTGSASRPSAKIADQTCVRVSMWEEVVSNNFCAVETAEAQFNYTRNETSMSF